MPALLKTSFYMTKHSMWNMSLLFYLVPIVWPTVGPQYAISEQVEK